MKSQLIIGLGEVGHALCELFDSKQIVYQAIDINPKLEGKFDMIHVCFPYSRQFIPAVKDYIARFLAPDGLVVIHSTVLVDTTTNCDSQNAVYSPVRGTHPHLLKGLKTFVKYFGGPRATQAGAFFNDLGLRTHCVKSSRDVEALKLWDTAYYGWNIIFNKEVKRWCDKYGIDFDLVYTHANKSYNDGYRALGCGDVIRPVLQYMKGGIGGHCVLNNCKLLLGTFFPRFIQKANKLFKIGQ